MEEEYDIRIDAFLGGNLTPEEEQIFLDEVETNEKLRNDLRLQDQINHFLSDRSISINTHVSNTYVKELKSIIDSPESNAVKEKIKRANIAYAYTDKKKNPFWKHFPMAAAIALIIFIGYSLFQGTEEKDVFKTYYLDSDLPSFVQRGDELTLLDKGINEFKSKKYDQALDIFNRYLLSNEPNSLVRIYTGLSNYYSGNTIGALKELTILENSSSLDASRAYWYKAFIYLKEDNINKAKQELEKTIQSPQNYKYIEAKKLLSEL